MKIVLNDQEIHNNKELLPNYVIKFILKCDNLKQI